MRAGAAGTSSCFIRSSICSAGATRSSGRSSPTSAGSPSSHISSRARIQRSAPVRIRKPAGTPTRQPSARSQPSAIEWNVPDRRRVGARSSSSMRCAHLPRRALGEGHDQHRRRVDAPAATRRRKRSAITAVLPVPAPATTRTGRRSWRRLRAAPRRGGHAGVDRPMRTRRMRTLRPSSMLVEPARSIVSASRRS